MTREQDPLEKIIHTAGGRAPSKNELSEENARQASVKSPSVGGEAGSSQEGSRTEFSSKSALGESRIPARPKKPIVKAPQSLGKRAYATIVRSLNFALDNGGEAGV